jgi:hypothetical protein
LKQSLLGHKTHRAHGLGLGSLPCELVVTLSQITLVASCMTFAVSQSVIKV